MIKLFTHTDLDGIGCEVVAKLAFNTKDKNNVDVEYCNYDNVDKKVKSFMIDSDEYKNYDMVFITDISIKDDLAKKINDECEGIYILLDHHATALNLNKYDWCTVNVEDLELGIKTSGTELFYKWLLINEFLSENNLKTKLSFLDKFVEIVRNYDTWAWSTMGEDGIVCKKVNDLMYLYGRDKFVKWCISEIYDCVFPKFYSTDELLLNNKQKEIDEYINIKDGEMFINILCGMKCGIVFAERFVSELGNRLCDLHPEIDFIVMINMGNNTVSYRTVKNDIDLGKDVAKLFGGGGHPKAAGSKFDNNFKQCLVDDIFTIENGE